MLLYKSKFEWPSFITAVLLLFFMRPYFVWWIYQFPFVRIGTLLLLCFMFRQNKALQLTAKYSFLSVLFCFTLILCMLVMLSHGNVNIWGVIDTFIKIFLVFILISSNSYRDRVYDSFFSIYSILILLSLVAWFLLPSGLLPNLGVISSFDADDRWFIHYPLLVIERSFEALRFNGPFDEPGVVGTIGAIFLCINKFNLKDIRNVVVLAASLLSLSFFFYVIISAYIVMYMLFVKKNIILVLLLAGAFVLFYQKTKDDPVFYATIWERAEWDPDTKEFKGDNRSNKDANAIFESKKGTSEYYWGLDNAELYNSYAKGSCTYKNVIATYGFVFFALYCTFFILLACNRDANKFSLFLYNMVLFANLYQRPSIYAPQIIFLFIVFAESLKKVTPILQEIKQQ